MTWKLFEYSEVSVKRSEINVIMREADEFIRGCGFYLPPFAYWSPETWQQKGPEVSEITDNRLGWDITDFGQGDYEKIGLFMFTIRNGHSSNWKTQQGKLYAEKILIVGKDQVTPMHFHWSKMEDIINRGGGTLYIQVYNATADEDLDRESDVHLSLDGVAHVFKPGDIVELKAGESISLVQRCYHKFWADGRTLVGEVSLVNDDNRDNRFHQEIGRFPAIEEDEAPQYLLVNDYARYYPHFKA
jgi:D-lyxose ketol-isomerase